LVSVFGISEQRKSNPISEMTDAPIGFLVIFSFIVIIYVTLAIAVELLVFVTFVGSPSPIPEIGGVSNLKSGWVT